MSIFHTRVMLTDHIDRLSAANVTERGAMIAEMALATQEYYAAPGKGSHMYEVTLVGVHARGETPEAMVESWLSAARNVQRAMPTDQDANAEAFSIGTMVAMARAMGIISRPTGWTAPEILQACDYVLANSNDSMDCNTAKLLKTAVEREVA